MSRDEEASLNARAEEARTRLCRGIDSSRDVVAQYRKRLLMLRAALQRTSDNRQLMTAASPRAPR
jgi:hypothetical protein